MATLTDLRQERINKLNTLKEMGVNPYPAVSARDTMAQDIISNYESMEGKLVTVAGRVLNIRNIGKLAFFVISDESARIQLYIDSSSVSTDSQIGFDQLNLFDTGDFVEATGVVTKSKTGEISVKPSKLTFLAKAILPLPTEHFGLKDTEERYRKRYLDLILNPEAKAILDVRWLMTQRIREFMWSKGFKEVETPVLQPLYGGTNAKPFTTHLNALDADFYLRIAPELYLKRLIVGGYEKIFEIARNFRNEGIDQTHFPEFSMLEWYEAYADYHKVMDRAEELTKFLVKEIYGGTKLMVNGKEIEIGEKWERIPIEDLLKRELGIAWDELSDEEAKELQTKYNIDVKGSWTKNKLLFALFEKQIAPNLIKPTFVIDYPKDVSPLSKSHRSKEGRTERFEGYIGGVEVYDGWSEIISGLEQRNRFETEQANMKEGDAEAMPADEAFLTTLEYGCPPLGGIGFGIERLAMFLTDNWKIKEVTAFPILKGE